LRFTFLAGLMAGFAAWTRNEGIIFVLALIVARTFALVKFRERALSQLPRLLAGLAAPMAVVIVFKLRVGGTGGFFSVPASAILKHLIDPSRWIMTVEGLVVLLFNFGRFLIPIALVLALYWYLVRFQVDARDRAVLATAALALGLTLAVQLLLDLAYMNELALEINTSFERVVLQLWPSVLLMFFLASGPLQLVAPVTKEKKAPRRARTVSETR
jgi:hypothetical protein